MLDTVCSVASCSSKLGELESVNSISPTTTLATMEEEITAASVGQEPPFVGAASAENSSTNDDNIGSTNTNSPAADDNSTTINNNRPQRLHFRIRNQDGTQININTSTTSEGRRRFNINTTPQVLLNNITANQQQPTPLRTGTRGPIVPPLEPQPLPHQQTNNVEDESGINNVVKGQEDYQGDESKKRADMKKFECAICVGKFIRYSGNLQNDMLLFAHSPIRIYGQSYWMW